ncbi:Autophagy-related protein 11 [Frankliniella fusca]|uniref:Autophagy-related protein 11 n=1 Tax=Frankliniella fusca TaxID=407009 RepID=A0AAE1I2J6_9NEOP|nr:Autophagy-related protein 11 [Frankliniella fusca]
MRSSWSKSLLQPNFSNLQHVELFRKTQQSSRKRKSSCGGVKNSNQSARSVVGSGSTHAAAPGPKQTPQQPLARDLDDGQVRVGGVRVPVRVAVRAVAVVARVAALAVAAPVQQHAVRHGEARLLQLVERQAVGAERVLGDLAAGVRRHLLPEDLALVLRAGQRENSCEKTLTAVKIFSEASGKATHYWIQTMKKVSVVYSVSSRLLSPPNQSCTAASRGERAHAQCSENLVPCRIAPGELNDSYDTLPTLGRRAAHEPENDQEHEQKRGVEHDHEQEYEQGMEQELKHKQEHQQEQEHEYKQEHEHEDDQRRRSRSTSRSGDWSMSTSRTTSRGWSKS